MPQIAFITGFPHLLTRSLTRLALYRGAENRALLLLEPQDRGVFERFMEELGPQAARVRPLYGDPTAPSFALSDSDLEAARESTLIFHAAQRRGPDAIGQNRARFEAAFALSRRAPELTRFVLFSSAFVSGDRAGIIEEEELEEGQRFRTSYERSLFLIERRARRLMPEAPITVLRPSAMIGHSRTGESSQLDEGPRELLQLLKGRSARMGRSIPFNIVPIDYVSRAAWELALAPEGESRTFHLTDPSPINTRQAYDLLRGLMDRLGARQPQPRGLERIKRWLRPSELNLSQAVIYRCSGALELLASAGVDCPPFEAYADLLIAWLARYEGRV